MHSVDFSYSYTPRCDSYTGMSLGLSLIAVLVTAAVFIVLAYRGYISPTVAYSVAPTIGAVFILIGTAVALIRKNNYTPVQISRLIETGSDITLEKEIFFHPPDPTHPYAYYTVTLNFGAYRISGIEILEEGKPNEEGLAPISFVYGAKKHTKQVQVFFNFWNPTLNRNAERNAFTQWDEELAAWSGKRYLLKEKYQILMQEGNNAEFFMVHDKNICMNTGERGAIFDIPDMFSYSLSGEAIIFERLQEECPEELIEGLKDHPHIISKLSAQYWTWNLPPYITHITVRRKYGKDLRMHIKPTERSLQSEPPLASKTKTNQKMKRPKVGSSYTEECLLAVDLFKQLIDKKIGVLKPANEKCPHDHYTMILNFEDYSLEFFYYEEAGNFKLSYRMVS